MECVQFDSVRRDVNTLYAQEAGGDLRNHIAVLLHIKINLPNSVKAK